ncbi:hypothetical protein P4E94_15705 [Pontiellaceae bacterium B12219]|nr:hypothetical protein [Pontiellaceae bacterium B12219]
MALDSAKKKIVKAQRKYNVKHTVQYFDSHAIVTDAKGKAIRFDFEFMRWFERRGNRASIFVSKQGYALTASRTNNKSTIMSRIVAEYYERQTAERCVCYIDGNPLNVTIGNLVVLTRAECSALHKERNLLK